MLKVGLTGGIGSGKSLVASFLSEFGAAIIDTDVIAHELTAVGGGAIDAIRAEFGSIAIDSIGALNRNKMREIVFEDKGARKRLESILHPLIHQESLSRAAIAQGEYIVFVVPLLVESKRWHNIPDRICVVDCEPETQIKRVKERSGLSVETINSIMSVQAGREERLQIATDVLYNGSNTTINTLKLQTLKLHNKWRSMRV